MRARGTALGGPAAAGGGCCCGCGGCPACCCVCVGGGSPLLAAWWGCLGRSWTTALGKTCAQACPHPTANSNLNPGRWCAGLDDEQGFGAHRGQGARPDGHRLGRRPSSGVPCAAAVPAVLGHVAARPGLLLLLVVGVGGASPVRVRAVGGGRPPSAVPLQAGSTRSQPELTGVSERLAAVIMVVHGGAPGPAGAGAAPAAGRVAAGGTPAGCSGGPCREGYTGSTRPGGHSAAEDRHRLNSEDLRTASVGCPITCKHLGVDVERCTYRYSRRLQY